MSNLMKSRKGSLRGMVLLGLALMILPAFASEASAQYREGGSYNRGYGARSYSRGYGGYNYGARSYSRGYGGYNYAPRVYNRGYGGYRGYAPPVYNYGPRVYNRGYGSFYNYGVPYGGTFGSPLYRPGFNLSIGGFSF